nr:non-ribosomal peptide synthase/polyketide synthase [uncultured Chitinophaga sp.]
MKKISPVQETIWLTQNIYTQSSIYNVGGYALVEGPLQETVLTRAIEILLKDADVLVTGYYAFNDVFMQDNPAFALYDIEVIDFSASADASGDCEAWMLADMQLPFLVQENLLKVCVLKANDNRYYWYTKVHHLVFDGYSMALFFNKVSVLYESLLRGATPDISTGIFPYADFIADGDAYRHSDDFKTDSSFWISRLQQQPGANGFESLVSAANSPALTSARKDIVVSRELYDQITAFCREYQCSVFQYFITSLLVLNHRYNNKIPCIGIPVFNRKNKKFKNTLGTFVNMLPFTTTFTGSQTFAAVLAQVKNDLKEVYKHQGFPLFDMLQELDGEGNIYNLSFSYQKNTYEQTLGDAAVTIQYLSGGEQQEALAFHLLEYGETADLTLGVDYRTALFTAESIDTLMQHFSGLLHSLLKAPDRCIDQIPFLSPAEEALLLADFNNTAASFRDNVTLTSLFEEQAARTPESTALVFEGRHYTYRVLNEQANRLAHYLRAAHAIVPDDRIGIQLHRSERMIVALLGTLKSGGAYVPIDPAYPQERIAYLLEDSQCKVLIDEQFFAAFEETAADYSIVDPQAVNTPSDLAYVIYTSGSTGQPKGCMLEHRGVVNRIAWMWQHYGFTTADIILQKTTFTFDVSVWELFMPLCWGARMVLCHKDDVGSPGRLLTLIENEKVTCLHFVPSMFSAFIATLDDQPSLSRRLSSLRGVMTSGEALPAETVNAWYQHVPVPVHNLYGPTEASVDVTYYTTAPGDTKVPIGRPIWNTAIHVLGAAGQLLPCGVTGEICIGGIGLSRGYLSKPALTAEKFVANPFLAGGRLYKTGDLGRWLPDGNIEYLGRKDDQVKVRGYRIEPGEIEAALLKHPSVMQVAVVAKTAVDGDIDLVAYLVGSEALSEASLKTHLEKTLPAYMVPAYYVPMSEFPLTANGKLDRKKLPDPEGLGMGRVVEYVAPSNPTEEKLVVIWQEILKREDIGVRDNFFDLGGHSLKATRLLSRIRQEFDVNIPLKDLFANASIEAQALQVAQSLKNISAGVTQTAVRAFYPLSPAQRRLWVLSQMEDGNVAYNMPGAYLFEGILDVEALTHAFTLLIARHESLRTVFREDGNGSACQLILTPAAMNFSITEEDLKSASPKVLRERLAAAAATPFVLSEGPLLRATLYQVADNQWVFSFIMHHIISDGWSMNILVKELLLVYQQHVRGEAAELQPLRIQYKDYAGWQEQQLASGAMAAHKNWWLSQFEGPLPVLELPADKVRPAVKTYRGNTIHTTIGKDLAKALKLFARKEEGTLFMSLLAGVNTLLYRYTHQADIIIGSPVAGRDRAELEDQIGLYINTLALRTRFNGEYTYTDLFRQVKETTLGAYEHQVFPLDEIVAALPLKRDRSRSALFDVMVVLQNNESTYLQQYRIGDLVINEYAAEERRDSKFDLLFHFEERGEEIMVKLTYNSDIYFRNTIIRLGNHLLQLLEALMAQPHQPLQQLDYLTAAEKQQLLVSFNKNTSAPAGDKTLTMMFEDRVAAIPGHTAIMFEGNIITYQALNEKANQLAHYLRAHFAPAPGERIAVRLERSEWMIIAILGVLKAGAAYVPVDIGHPQQRIDYILADSQCKAVIDEQQMALFRRDMTLYDTTNPEPTSNAKHLAYVIYTSGSTGQPKGVMIRHAAIVNYLHAITRTYGMDASDRVLQISNVAFDASVEQIMGGLLSGAALYIAPQATITDTEALSNYIVTHKITHLHTVPVLLDKLKLDGHALKRMISAGDNCPITLAEKYRHTLAFYNKYGPTEATVSATIYHVTPQAVLNSVIPIGKPVANNVIYILDEQEAVLPIGVFGEICIGGAGLAEGYLHQPEMTAAKFVTHPFLAGERIYKTGDIGRWLPDGNIEYLGRKDDQVKVRGYRIELGEIENRLASCPGISAVAVVAKTNAAGEKDLVAYVVGQPDLQVTTLKSHLAKTLPAYMVPAHYVLLEALPLNANGKVDRRQLPDPEGLGMESAVAYVAARNSTEEKLVAIWQEILGKEKISTKDNFFDLGGHSLKATRLVSLVHRAFDVKLRLKDLFTAATLEEQALLISGSGEDAFTAIALAETRDSYPLSAAQRRLWVLSQFEEGSMAYNMPGVCRFEGNFNRASLVYAFEQLVARHESLRTIFREDEDGSVAQVVLTAEALRFRIREQDLRHAPAGLLEECIEETALTPFNLGTGPLLRASLYQVADASWVFVYAMHHIISDGWSMNVLRRELLQYYYAHSRGEALQREPLRIQYKDYASWQQSQLNGEGLQAHKAWWLSQFAGELPVLELPADQLRPAVKTYNGGVVHASIGAAATAGLRVLVQEEGGTLFMGLLAAVNALLYRYTSQPDIIIGSPVAGREHADLEDQIGFYINTLALRTHIDGDRSFRELLRQVKTTTLGAYEHQLYPFDELVDALELQRDMSRSALFDVMVVLQNNEQTAVAAPQEGDMAVKEFNREGRQLSKFDLLFDFSEQADSIRLSLTYNSDIYAHATISRLSGHLQQLLAAIAAEPAQALKELDYLSAAEKHQLLTVFNDTASGKPASQTLSQLFEAQVRRTPQQVAVEAAGGSFTYAALHGESNRFGHYLRDKYNIRRGELIGVKLDRSEWLIAVLLGILKSGGAYVPIDPAYPQERIDYLLADSNCRVVVDGPELAAFLRESAHYRTTDLSPVTDASDLAYVIYTSGSTGHPKGVMIEHRNAHAFINWCEEEFAASCFDIVLAVTSICFDLSVFEIFYTLSTGKKIRLLDSALSITANLHQGEKVLLNTVPSVVNTLLNEGADLGAVTVLNMAGEPIPAKVVAGLDTERMEVRNLYGPSEDTTYSTIYRIKNGGPILIGKPIADTQVYIVNDHGRLQPCGVAGEICISGSGLSRGYLNKPELTSGKFIPHPFIAGARLYKTGDLGRWLPDGNIDYLGRKDDQVKIRGHRIELGEIESALLKHAAIEAAVVIAKVNTDGEKELVAYVVGKSEDVPVTGLKAFLGHTLPGYMLPAYYIPLAALPLTANGKLDKKQLPDPSGQHSEVEYVAAGTDTEEKLVRIWQEILGKDRIGVRDNFFDLGGHSLKATRLASQVHRIFNVKLTLKDLFANATLEQQAVLLSQSKKSTFSLIAPAPVQEAYALSSAQRRLWVLSQFEGGSVAYNMPGVYCFEGELNVASLAYAFEQVIARHESLRTVFRENESGDVCQWVLAPEMLPFNLVTDDLQHATAEMLQERISAAVGAPFDLTSGPLLRAALYQVAGNKWVFAYAMHHIISDGWSLNIFLKELLQYYHAHSRGETLQVEPLRIQYKDYANWQYGLLNGKGIEEHRNWWLSQFAGEIPVLELPGEKMRPAIKTYHGGVVYHTIGAAATAGLRAMVHQEGATMFMGLLAAVNALIYRYTHQADIIIGSPVAGREHADLEEQIGFYVNTLALRTTFDSNNSFPELLRLVKANTMEAYEHQLYPFDELVDALDLKRDMSRNALFDVMLVLQNNEVTYTGEQRQLNNLVVTPFQRKENTSKFDLLFNCVEQEDGIRMSIAYNADIYSDAMVTRLGHHLEQLIMAATTAPQLPVAQLSYLTVAEQRHLLQDLNDTAAVYPEHKTIVDLFSEQVVKTPDHIAVCYNGKNTTYRELNERSDRLAQYLKIKYAVYPDDLIAIKLERSEAFVVTILGILKSGAAYLPIDPDYPPERARYMEQDSKCLVSIDAAFYERFLLQEAEYAALPVYASLHPEHLVYVIYTSGSTGNPKGIMMKHRAMVNLMNYHIGLFPEGEVKSVLQFASVSFDVSFQEIFTTLLRGATLYPIAEDKKKDVTALVDFIVQHQLDTIFLPTAYFKLLMEEAYFLSHIAGVVRHIIVAGEQLILGASFIDLLHNSDLVLHNHYGPAETHVVTTIMLEKNNAAALKKIPSIGKPIHNSSIYILDNRQALTAFGVPGEICIGGTGMARGYLHRPDLTAEKFIPHPFMDGQVLYRTGDLGRWLPDGNIEYIGRKDEQVKVRGYRIEPGEIETALAACPGVNGAAVVAKTNPRGEKDLVAYVVCQPDLQMAVLKSHLSKILPAYMVPSCYVPLEALPITSNGKLDRRQLPDPEGLGMESTVAYVAARNSTEEKLVAIWQEILGKEKISTKDNFFDLGGHSLKATRLVSLVHRAFDVKLRLKDLFTAATLEEQALLISGSGEDAFTAIALAETRDSYPLSAAQRRLWVLSQFEEGSMAYNMPGVCRFEGNFNRASLVYAFEQLVARHESLRTIFREDEDGSVAQVVLTAEALRFRIREQDLRHAPAGLLEECIEETALTPFNLGTGPLLRASLYQVADASWVFVYAMHHIISDGWSMNVLRRELLQYYYAHSRGEALQREPLRIQYKDYASWQQSQLNGEGLQAHKAWWLSQFAGELPVLELPADQLRPAVKTYNGGVVHASIGAAATAGLRVLVQEEGGTLFMGLLAAVNALLYRYTSQPDIIIGSPVAGREHADLEDQIGFYINTLALRTHIDGDRSFRELLRQVKTTTLGAYEHQLYPFDELVDALELQRDMSRSALFDVMVVLQNNEQTAVAAPQEGDMAVKEFNREGRQLSKFDLLFDFSEQADSIRLSLTYNSDIYAHATISRLSGHLQQLLAAIAAEPAQALKELDYLSAAEKHQLLTVFNDTASGKPASQTLSQLFEAQVRRTPQQVAVEAAGGSFTYAALHGESNRFGHYLRDKYNIRRGELIGVKLDRSEWLIAVLLGILKSGGAYVPIDPAYPQERIDYLLADSNCRVVVDGPELAAFLRESAHYRTTDLSPVTDASDLAYVIYTSGSTGHPKGVMIEHRNAHAFINWCEEEFAASCFDIVLAVTSICFDLSVFEIFYTLSTGKKIRLLDSALSITANLHQGEKVLLNTVPSVVNTLLNEGADLGAVTVLNMAGEPIPAKVVAGLDTERMEVRNLYGPSEDTTYSTIYRIKNGGPILIGKPIADTQVYIVNDHGRLQPCGVAGEICISGSGLSRGYLNKPELTSGKFIPHPFIAGARLYKTGDLGRWLPDGNIDYLGRKDDQVKIRGHRIELGEIESALLKHAAIEAAVVIAKVNTDGEKELVAYVVGKSEDVPVTGLKAFLGHTLPGYMLPAYYIPLAALPLTANGKLDKKQLPDPSGQHSEVEYVAAGTDTEEKLVRIWQEILGKDRIGVRDNFFDLGGHSLKATRLASRIHQVFDVKLSLKDLFSHAELQAQAALLSNTQKQAFVAIEPVPVQADYPVSFSQHLLWVACQFEESNVAYNIPGVYIFDGPLDCAALELAFTALISRHESLRTVFATNEKGVVRQRILLPEQSGFRITYHDLTSAVQQKATVHERIQEDVLKPFDLKTGPLLRVSLYQLEQDKWVFSYIMHHIISDGWSMNILLKELMLLYRWQVNKEAGGILNPLRIQYKDYTVWQQKLMQGAAMEHHKNWWLRQFEGELPVLQLPMSNARPAVKTHRGAVVSKIFSKQLYNEVLSLVHEQGSTLFTGLLAAVNTLLYRYSDQEDIILGTPVAGREHVDLEGQIGFYVNTLAIRTRLRGEDSFLELLQQVKQATMGAFEHQHYPFEHLTNALELQRDRSRSPLFDVNIILQRDKIGIGEAEQSLGNLKVSPYGSTGATRSKFDLTFSFAEVADALHLSIIYNADLFDAATVEGIMADLERLLNSIVNNPATVLYLLDYQDAVEKHRLLSAWNEPTDLYPEGKTVIALLEEAAAIAPDMPAAELGHSRLTCREVNEMVNRMAVFLQQQLQVKPGQVVSITLTEAQWHSICVLAAWKAGAVWLVTAAAQTAKSDVVIDDDVLVLFVQQRKRYPAGNLAHNDDAGQTAFAVPAPAATHLPLLFIPHSSLVTCVACDVAAYQQGDVPRFISQLMDVQALTPESIYTKMLAHRAVSSTSHAISALFSAELSNEF